MVLLVEDNTEDLELMMYAIRGSQLASSINVVRDGEEALDFIFCRGKFCDRPPDKMPRLVILDLKLPKVGGLEVLRNIKENLRTRLIPVVVLTSSKEERDLLECYQSGANSYIQKPMSFEEFRDTVKKVGAYWLGINEPLPASALRSRVSA